MDNANLYDIYSRNFPTERASEFLRTNDGLSFSYTTLDQESARLARFLTQLGLKPGDRVTVQAEKTPNFIWLYLACLRGGFVFHPLNPAYTSAEVRYFLEDAEPTLLVHDSAFASSLTPLADTLKIKLRYTLDVGGGGTLLDAAANTDADFESVTSAPDALAALLYSSGTTGKPKGIMLSHVNLASNARALAAAWGFGAQDVLLHVLPLFHVHGLFIALGCSLMSGSRVLFCPRFEVAETLRLLPAATVMMGVPTYYTRLLATTELSRGHCRNVRLFTSGSAPLASDTWHAFDTRTRHQILERYGMTETSVITTNPLNGARKPSAVGVPLPDVEVRIVNDAGEGVPAGETGHVQVRGPSVFKGYWRLPEKTREDFAADGFFRTGDDGRIDEDGYLFLVGRAKDLIITGGLNVYPSEVEGVLDDLPGVLESAVIGLPHADFGEQVIAVIVAKPKIPWDEHVVRNAVRTQLAPYKCPKRYVVCAALPRNAMGKVQKNVLRETYATDGGA